MLLCQEGSCLCLILKRCIEGGRVGAYLFPGHSDQLLFCVEVGGGGGSWGLVENQRK